MNRNRWALLGFALLVAVSNGIGRFDGSVRRAVFGAPPPAPAGGTEDVADRPPHDIAASAAGRRGMTWARIADHGVGEVEVGCQAPGGMRCDAYRGDTPCSTLLPLLCIAPAGTPPAAAASLALSSPVQGDAFATRQGADAHCARAFGSDWRIAEFHDNPGGWTLAGRGRIADGARFWVDINDQQATCWRARPPR